MIRLTILAAALLLAAGPALAEKPATPGFCPPGLAKKNPPCIPPGQAKKAVPAPAPVPVVVPDRIVMLNPADYPDWCASRVVQSGGVIYRVDRQTGAVLDVIAPAEDWAWDWDQVDFAHCPPGLAKKNPPCVPPGQVGRYSAEPLTIGTIVPADAFVLIDPAQCTPVDQSPVVRQGNAFLQGLSGDDKAILALSLLAASMK